MSSDAFIAGTTLDHWACSFEGSLSVTRTVQRGVPRIYLAGYSIRRAAIGRRRRITTLYTVSAG